MKEKQNKVIKLIVLVLTIIVLIVLAGVGINLVLGNKGIVNKEGNEKQEGITEINTESDESTFENDDYKKIEKNINNNIDYIRFLNNSLTAYYLENQNENISDVETFLKNYDNNMKLSDLLSFEERKTKEEVLNDENKLLGYDTNLKFEDVYTNNYKTEGKKEEYLLYKFSDNTFNINDDCDWNSRFWNLNSNSIYHYIIDVEKSNNIITLYSKNIWTESTGGDDPARMFFASYNDYKESKNHIIYDDAIGMNISSEEEWDLKYTQALFSYNNVLSKLNTYEYKIEVTGDTYRILSYKMIDN